MRHLKSTFLIFLLFALFSCWVRVHVDVKYEPDPVIVVDLNEKDCIREVDIRKDTNTIKNKDATWIIEKKDWYMERQKRPPDFTKPLTKEGMIILTEQLNRCDPRIKRIKLGETPEGYFQIIPENNKTPEFKEGVEYTVTVLTYSGGGSKKFINRKVNNSIEKQED